MRVLANCFRSRAGARSRATRALHPHRCTGCSSPDVRWVWTSGDAATAGVAWCYSCTANLAPGSLALGLWAEATNDDSGVAPVEARQWLSDFGPHLAVRSPYCSCPLCGAGELGGEHLLMWCPSVAGAWRILLARSLASMESSHGWHLLPVFLSDSAARTCPSALRAAAGLIHQAAYLAGCTGDATPLSVTTASLRLVRMTCSLTRMHPDLGHATDAPPVDQRPSVEESIDPWDVETSCAACPCTPSVRLSASVASLAGRRLHRPPLDVTKSLVASSRIGSGAILVDLRAPSAPAPLPPSCPLPVLPRVVDCDATARWECDTCRTCGHCMLRLASRRELHPGEEISVDAVPNWLPSRRQWTLDVTFDGGASASPHCAGSGAVLWAMHPDSGDWLVAAVVAIALPGEHRAPVSEAWAAHAAIVALMSWRGARIARVSGDNLAVVRYCNSQGGLMQHLQAILDGPVTALAVAGWDVEWQAVRRKWNVAADAAATLAKRSALSLSRSALWQPRWGIAVSHWATPLFGPFRVPSEHVLDLTWHPALPEL